MQELIDEYHADNCQRFAETFLANRKVLVRRVRDRRGSKAVLVAYRDMQNKSVAIGCALCKRGPSGDAFNRYIGLAKAIKNAEFGALDHPEEYLDHVPASLRHEARNMIDRAARYFKD